MKMATRGSHVRGDTEETGWPWGPYALYLASLGCLFGFGVNAFGLHYVFLIIAMMLLILAAPHQLVRMRIDNRLVTLLVFSATYSMQVSTSTGQIFLNFLYPVAYMVGTMAVRMGDDACAQFRRVVLSVAAGVTLHGVLNAVSNVQSYGWTPGERVLPDYWTQAPLTATLQATLFIPLVGVAFYGLAERQEQRSVVAVLTGLGLLVAGLYNLVTASRTIFVVMLVTLIACALVPRGRRMLRLTILAAVAAAFQRLYALDVLGLRTFVESSALMGRVSSGEAPGFGEDPRFERWGYVFDNFWDHVSGGRHFRSEIGYVHNLWLDAYDVGGLLPFVALVGFTLSALVLLWRMLVIRALPVGLKVLAVGVWTALLAQFMTEPILDGVPMLFAVFCIFCGAGAGLETALRSPS